MKKLLFALLCTLIASTPSASSAQTVSTVVHPDWTKNATIYEANIRQYSPEGTFKKFEEYLPELKKMGVGVIWIMPINPIGEVNRKGKLGSYYSVADYLKVNPEFGTPEDFHHLVDAIHAQGMKVIIDWVANHTAWDHPWVKSHPEYYVHDKKGHFVPPVPDWADVIKLDYRNPQLRAEMINSLKYWITEYDLDGFRCDVAAMVPTDFWNEARKQLDQVKPVFMLAEAFEPRLQEHAFDMTYAWQLKDLWGQIAKGKKNASALTAYMKGEEARYNPNSYRMLHTSNHDLNSWEGTEYDRLGDGVETFLVMSNTLKGMPLLYEGQEAGNTKALDFFDRDPIVWKDHKFRELYTKLFHLKQTNHALWNGLYGGQPELIKTSDSKNIFAFSRSKDGDQIIAIFNLSSTPRHFSSTDPVFIGKFTDPLTGQAASAPQELQAWEYRLLVRDRQ